VRAILLLLLLPTPAQDPHVLLLKAVQAPPVLVPQFTAGMRPSNWLDHLQAYGQSRGVDVFARGVAPLMTDGER